MLKKLLPYTRGFRLRSVLTSLFVALEALLEVFIPFLMMKIVDVGIANHDLPYVFKTGGLMVLVAMGSLCCGVLSARLAAVSATCGGGCSAASRISALPISTVFPRPA